MPVWEKLIFKMTELVVYAPPGKKMAILNAQVVCSWFYVTPNHTQALASQGGTQGSGTQKDGVSTATGESRVCRESSAPTFLLPKRVASMSGVLAQGFLIS